MPKRGENLSGTFIKFTRPGAAHFEYGRCRTDWKSGEKISAEHREHDYLQDEPYATKIKNILQQMGLPCPKPEDIFRGTHHDMLFLNSHGVVIRIGPADLEDLMNPAFLQPLGWLETDLKVKNKVPERFDKFASHKEVPLVVAIYPGIELYDNWSNASDSPEGTVNLQDFLHKTGQACDFDMSDYNQGVIRVVDDDGKEVAVEIMLDSENEWNPSSPELYKKRFESLRKMEQAFGNKADVIFQMMQDVFGTEGDDLQYLYRAFETHQPLRRLFWDAFKNVTDPWDRPDPALRKAFWDSCAQVTNHPETAIMPCWRQETNAEGKTIFVPEEVYVPHVVLYRQWTKEEADKVIQPIAQMAVLKAAVQTAHRKQKVSPKGATPTI